MRAPIVMEGGTTFHFVTDGIEAALAQAKAAAGDLDVKIGGGVSTIRQYLLRSDRRVAPGDVARRSGPW
jgi:dihydrofolate reductase